MLSKVMNLYSGCWGSWAAAMSGVVGCRSERVAPMRRLNDATSLLRSRLR